MSNEIPCSSNGELLTDIGKFTHDQLIGELNRRLTLPAQPIEPLNYTLRPFKIMEKMVSLGWKEDTRLGFSNSNIDRMWKYLGYPQNTDDQSWCACTLNTCLKLAGFETSISIPVARSFESYGKEIKSLEVLKGDIVVFNNRNGSWQGHVGLVDMILSDCINVLGGNQNNTVCFKNIYRNDSNLMIKSYRRITNMNKIGPEDTETLRIWGLL